MRSRWIESLRGRARLSVLIGRPRARNATHIDAEGNLFFGAGPGLRSLPPGGCAGRFESSRYVCSMCGTEWRPGPGVTPYCARFSEA